MLFKLLIKLIRFDKIYDIGPIFKLKEEQVFTPFQIIGILITIESCVKIIEEIRSKAELIHLNELINQIDIIQLKEITNQIKSSIRV